MRPLYTNKTFLIKITVLMYDNVSILFLFFSKFTLGILRHFKFYKHFRIILNFCKTSDIFTGIA